MGILYLPFLGVSALLFLGANIFLLFAFFDNNTTRQAHNYLQSNALFLASLGWGAIGFGIALFLR